jgi:hypothetical protein
LVQTLLGRRFLWRFLPGRLLDGPKPVNHPLPISCACSEYFFRRLALIIRDDVESSLTPRYYAFDHRHALLGADGAIVKKPSAALRRGHSVSCLHLSASEEGALRTKRACDVCPLQLLFEGDGCLRAPLEVSLHVLLE